MEVDNTARFITFLCDLRGVISAIHFSKLLFRLLRPVVRLQLHFFAPPGTPDVMGQMEIIVQNFWIQKVFD